MDRSNRFVRVKAFYKDDSDYFLQFDCKIDHGDRIEGIWELYGKYIDDTETAERQEFPAILTRDGTIDFGPGNENYSTNIRERVIRVGELCTVWDDDAKGKAEGDEYTYEISSVAVLGEAR